MPEAPSREAIARTTLPETRSTRPPHPTETAAGKELREAVAKAREGTVAEALVSAIDERRASNNSGEAAVKNNIGVERDANGNKVIKPGSPEKARHDQAVVQEKLVRDFLEFGYDGLKLPGGGVDVARQGELRAHLDRLLTSIKLYDSLLPPPGDPARAEIIEDMLRDKRVVASIKARYQEVAATRLEDQVTEKKNSYDQAAAADKAKRAEQSENARKLKDLREERADLTSMAPGSKGAELVTLRASNPKTLAARDTAQADLNESVQDVADARRELRFPGVDPARKTNLEGFIRTETRRHSALRTKIDGYNRDIARFNELDSRLRAVPGEIQAAEEAEITLKDEVLVTTRNKGSANLELIDAKSQRSVAEENFVSDLKNIVEDGVANFLKEAIEEAERLAGQQSEEAIKTAKTELDSKIAKWKFERYHTKKGKNDYETNKGNVKNDFDALMDASKGPKSILRKALIDTGMSESAADLWISNNPEPAAEYYKSFASEALSGHLRTGGKITEGQAQFIFSQPWGENIVNEAVAKNDAAKSQIDQLREKGVMGKNESALEFLRKNKGKAAATGLLAIILAAISAVTGLGRSS